jgi:branched-chain amino acid transport system substrate-binding protein
MRFAITFISAAVGLALFFSPSHAAEGTIGLAAPLTGSFAILGEQMAAGANAATDTSSSGQYRIEIADTACTPEGGAAAARQFVAAEVEIVTGFLCGEAIEAALPILAEAGIPVVTTGVRTDSLTDRRDRTGWPVFRLAPRADAEMAAVSDILTERWRSELFAIIDDGTIYSRDLAEGFRLAAEQANLQPVYVDTFRPQLDNQIGLAGRLRNAGATHVFAGGDRDDLAILGRDATELGMDLTIAGGEALRSAPGEVDLAPGTLMVGLPDWEDVAAEGRVRALREAEIEPEGYVLPSYAAIEIATAALGEAEDGQDLVEILQNGRFETALGPISFDEKGDLSENPYRLFRYDGDEFRELD